MVEIIKNGILLNRRFFMDLSILLAKLLGIYMLIIAALWILRKDQMDALIKDFISSKGLIAFSGSMTILLGLSIAIEHPIWQLNWRGLITLLGYIMIFRGIMRFAFAEKVQQNALKIISKGYWIMIAVLIVLGGFLTYCGFVLR